MPRLEADSYALLTRPPLPNLRWTVRLACLRHAASVHPEPGSNSQKNFSSHRRKEPSCHILGVNFIRSVKVLEGLKKPR